MGSEGTLGIATKITLRVIPLAESHETMVAYFESIEAAGQAVSDGPTPRTRSDVGAALIVELDGPKAECDACSDDVLEIFKAAGASGTRPGTTRGGR